MKYFFYTAQEPEAVLGLFFKKQAENSLRLSRADEGISWG
ncbi:hypothetical protein FHS90_001593 [Rufibacter quisquiliarum]|uniref:Uncharacterized protein n=1 Tax=Rufibacter quisquiliarum TaxID=1549639 RepID=A0A839GMW1_9BACT|nr:hypothetical protein [Rufibacter quisquiliarum]